MYSFAQRHDTAVFDEPLYAHYLANINPAAFRPYREEVLKVQDSNGDAVVRDIILGPAQRELEARMPVFPRGLEPSTDGRRPRARTNSRTGALFQAHGQAPPKA
jgi:hypothetical protein